MLLICTTLILAIAVCFCTASLLNATKLRIGKVNKVGDEPLCEEGEACSIKFGSMQLPLACNCGPQATCQKDPLFEHGRNMGKYHFCGPSRLLRCKYGQTALEVDGYRNFFQCYCPDNFELVSTIWIPGLDKTRYACALKDECEDDDICQQKVTIKKPRRVTNLRTFCECPNNMTCSKLVVYVNKTIELAQWACE